MEIAQMLALAMLAGSIPFGHIAVRLKSPGLARDAGVTLDTIRHAVGLPGLVLVVILNVAKGFVPVFLTLRGTDSMLLAAAVGAVAVLSHCFPYWLMFKPSGKGGSVALGALLGIIVWFLCRQ